MDEKKNLSDKEAIVLACLPIGKQLKISLHQLIQLSGYSDRSVRQALQSLKEKGVPIIADFRPSYKEKGYFIAETEEERDLIKSYERMGQSILKQAALIRQADLINWRKGLAIPEDLEELKDE